MKNPIASLFHSVVKWFRATRRIRPEQPFRPSRPSTSLRAMSLSNGDRQQAVKEFRSMVLDMFSDPETRRLLLPHLVTVFPMQGGMPCTAGNIPKFVGSCTDLTDSVIAESSNKIGIGTTSPAVKLQVVDASSYYPASFLRSGQSRYIHILI
ncbi:MAG: hypothetical protein HY649_00795 [Acidobacteria bacterium]|nr:hypothetical protein [Acidobacteriota bacterium]